MYSSQRDVIACPFFFFINFYTSYLQVYNIFQKAISKNILYYNQSIYKYHYRTIHLVGVCGARRRFLRLLSAKYAQRLPSCSSLVITISTNIRRNNVAYLSYTHDESSFVNESHPSLLLDALYIILYFSYESIYFSILSWLFASLTPETSGNRVFHECVGIMTS